MSAGELRERVAFESIAEDDSSYGIMAGDWEEQFRRAARIESAPGSEPVISQRLTGVNPVWIKTRADAETETVDASWRIKDVRANVYYNIRSVVPDERGKYIRFLVERGVAVNA